MRCDDAIANPAPGGLLVVISGPSGVGKTTITHAVRTRFADASFSVSATTRAPGPAERDGLDYHFLSDEEFRWRVAKGDFLEHAEYAGSRYGTLRAPIEAELRAGRLVILDIDVEGAKQIHEQTPSMFGLFILPPSEEELLRRLRERKREPEDAIQRRLAKAQREIEEARSSGVYDAFIVNDDLARATEEAMRLVSDARDRTRDDG